MRAAESNYDVPPLRLVVAVGGAAARPTVPPHRAARRVLRVRDAAHAAAYDSELAAAWGIVECSNQEVELSALSANHSSTTTSFSVLGSLSPAGVALTYSALVALRSVCTVELALWGNRRERGYSALPLRRTVTLLARDGRPLQLGHACIASQLPGAPPAVAQRNDRCDGQRAEAEGSHRDRLLRCWGLRWA